MWKYFYQKSNILKKNFKNAKNFLQNLSLYLQQQGLCELLGKRDIF